MIGGMFLMSRRKVVTQGILIILLMVLFFVILLCCLCFQTEITCEIIIIIFSIWMISNIFQFVCWITK